MTDIEAVAKKLAKAVAGAERTGGEGTAKAILVDLASGRRGWYHDTVGCYIDIEALTREDLREAALKAADVLQITLPEDACYVAFYGL